jgi:hypothetical protein
MEYVVIGVVVLVVVVGFVALSILADGMGR